MIGAQYKLVLLVSLVFGSLFITCVFNSQNNQNDQGRYNFLGGLFDAIDSTQSDSIGQVRIYLDYEFNHPDWEKLMTRTVANHIRSRFPTEEIIFVELRFPKINPIGANFYLCPFEGENQERTAYFTYVVNSFTPSDFSAFDEFFRLFYDHHKEEIYNVTFMDMVLGLWDTDEDPKQRNYDWTNHLDLLLELEILSQIEREKLIDLKESIDESYSVP